MSDDDASSRPSDTFPYPPTHPTPTHTTHSLSAALKGLTKEEAKQMLATLRLPNSNRTLGPNSAQTLVVVYQ